MPNEGEGPRPLRTDQPVAALGLVAGPVAFVGAWVVGGRRMPEAYAPVEDAISRIAAIGSPERTLMTAGFVAYGCAVLAGSAALRTSPLHRCWWLAALNGAATLAVAATPLEHSGTVDVLHGVAATTGYVSLAALPIVAAGPLRDTGRPRLARASVALGSVVGACLAATVVTEADGAMQRLGLTLGDVWLVATGVALWRSRRR